jgi:hypothetical protein
VSADSTTLAGVKAQPVLRAAPNSPLDTKKDCRKIRNRQFISLQGTAIFYF